MSNKQINLNSYLINPFVNFRILDPLSKKLTKQQRVTCLAISIFLGVITGGLLHAAFAGVRCYSQWQNRFRVIKRGEKFVHVRPTRAWKSFNNGINRADLSYVKPKVDDSYLKTLPKHIQERVKTNCIEKMRASMNVLDCSITDAVHEVIKRKDHADILNTVNTFSSRLLDIYEAYVQVQIDEKISPLPKSIGKIKTAGFTHEEILKLPEPCKWYCSKAETFKEKLIALSVSIKNAQKLVELVASKNYEKIALTSKISSIPIKDKCNNLCNDFITELQSLGVTKKEAIDILELIGTSKEEAIKNKFEKVARAHKIESSKIKEKCDNFHKNFITELESLKISKKDISEIFASITSDKIEKIAREQGISSDQIRVACDNFHKELNKNSNYLKIIKNFDKRVAFEKRHMTQSEKEERKRRIAEFVPVPPKDISFPFSDPEFRLLEEIRQRMGGRSFEPGNVASPLMMLNVLRGKHDGDSFDKHYRTKLFFIYTSKNIINEISKSPKFISKLNKKIAEKYSDPKKKWQINSNLIDYFRKRSNDEPVYQLGVYARENLMGKRIRHWVSREEYLENRKLNPNHTFADAERIASKKNANQQELSSRFRMKLTDTEEMSFFGTNSAIEESRLKANKKKLGYIENYKPSTIADSHFFETTVEYQKRNRQIHWASGQHFCKLHDNVKNRSSYFDAIQDLGLSQYAGISGSTEQTLTMAGVLGIDSKEELMNLRLIYIPWMVNHEDHSAHEILMAAKSFGLEYTPAPDYYKHLYPNSKGGVLNKEMKKAHKERGFELPDYYLSKEYIQIAVEQVKKEIEAEELEKDKKVKELQSTDHLHLTGLNIYRKNYSLEDLFGDKKWDTSTNVFTNKKIAAVNAARKKKRSDPATQKSDQAKFILNNQSITFDPYVRPATPFYKGTKKICVTLVPPSGKVIPFVHFDHPHLNRVGLLFDANQSQFKSEQCVFSSDANTDREKKWKKRYTAAEMSAADFAIKSKKDAEAAYKFNQEKAHQTTLDQLKKDLENHKDEFIPYNEINASVHNKGIVGIYVFSKGLPTNIDGKVPYKNASEFFNWKPLHHESLTKFKKDAEYDRYMRLMGVGKKIATREKFGIDVPLYHINETTKTGLTVIPRAELIREMHQILENKNKEQDGLVRIIKHQSDFKASDKDIKKALIKKIKHYLERL